MEFNERHHAFISATFYDELKKQFPINGIATFVLATQRYGEQRGSRMAQRAIRDGKELDFATYCAYGEWTYTEDYFANFNHIEVVSKSPDYHYLVHACPWHDQYKEMDLIEGASVYCKHLDLAIARGFNPYLTFEVRSTLHQEGQCDFVLHGADLEAKAFSVDKSITQKPFDYHCGHIYKTFCEIVTSIHREKGEKVCVNVSERFSNLYGYAKLNHLRSFLTTDFNLLPD